MAVMIETKDLTYTYPAPEGETNPPALRARGLDIDPAVYTVEALEQRLLALRGGAGAC